MKNSVNIPNQKRSNYQPNKDRKQYSLIFLNINKFHNKINRQYQYKKEPQKSLQPNSPKQDKRKDKDYCQE